MADQIRMSPEQMRTRATEFSREGDNIQTTIDTMQRLINELRNEWEGSASASFEQQFESLKPSFNDMRNLVEDISKQLTATAQAMEDLDRDIASKFQ